MFVYNSYILQLHTEHEQERIRGEYQRWHAPLPVLSIIRRLLLALLLVLLASSAWSMAHGQTRECRDIDNITVCADLLSETGGGNFTMGENITFGPRGGEPVIRVVETHADTTNIFSVPSGFFFGSNPGGGAMPQVMGALEFINDPPGKRLVQSTSFAGNFSSAGLFFVDTEAMRIYNPQKEEVPDYQDLNMPRNGTIIFPFLGHTGIDALIREEDPIEVADIDIEIDLNERAFHAKIPFDLDMPGDAENAKVSVTARITIDEEGNFSGGLDGFKLQAAGLKLDVKNVRINQGSATRGATFRAETIDVLRAENPGMPNLDPAHPDLVFRLHDLRYADGNWSLSGGEVPVPNWEMGPFKFFQPTVGLTLDDQTKTYTFNISATIFGDPRYGMLFADPGQKVQLRLGTRQASNGEFKPFMETHFPTNQPMVFIGGHGRLFLKGYSVIIDPVGNFHGIKSQQVRFGWGPAYGGGTGVEPDGPSVALEKFVFGINNSGDAVIDLGGSAVAFPPMENGVFSGQLSGAISVEDETLTFAMNGQLNLNIQGNTGISTAAKVILRSGGKVEGLGFCDSEVEQCLPAQDIALTGFGFKVAGFTIQVDNPRGVDGGFAADKATLVLPLGVSGSAGVSINGLQVFSEGHIAFSGGTIELPPIEVQGYQFVGLKGQFQRLSDGNYRFLARGTMPLPGLDPTSDKKITALVEFQDSPFKLGVGMTFKTASPGIPIGGTGMELLEIGGRFDLNQGTAKITVNMMAGSQMRVAGLPLVTARGQAALQVRPFAMTANAQLSVLVFDVANASMGIGAGQGFNGGSGFNASFDIDIVVLEGGASIRLGDVRLSNGSKEFRWAADAFLDVGIRKHKFGRFLPPVNLNVGGARFKGGTFKRSDGRELAGMLGTVKCCFFFKTSVFYNFRTDDVSLVNADNYRLLDSQQVRALAMQKMMGYSSHMMSSEEIAAAGLVLAAGADASQIMQETIPINVEAMGATLIGIDYPSGNPQIRVQLPNGTIMTEQAVDDVTSTFIRDFDEETGTRQLAFILKDAVPGTYTLLIDNAPANYEKVSYTINNAPDVQITSATCVGPVGSAPDVTVTCSGAPAGNFMTLTWNATDSDSPDATVSVGYAPLAEDGVSADTSSIQVLQSEMPQGNNSISWDLTEVPSGSYKLVVTMEDGKNQPVQNAETPIVNIVDQRPPAVPDLSLGDNEKLPAGQRIYWLPNTEQDFAGYEIGFGPNEDPNSFVYTRTIGLKDVEEERGMVSAQLWGLEDNIAVFVGVRTFDVSGNYSAWSELSEVVPWDLSPHGWTPAPNSAAGTNSEISVAFGSPLKPDSMAGALELTDANGNLVAGSSEFITNLIGDQVLGLRFVPTVELTDGMTYTVKILGGNDGVSTVDNRMMANHYRWQFIADATLGPIAGNPDVPIAAVVLSHSGRTTPGSALTFSAEVVSGDNVTYLWDMGDGTQRPGATVTHAYPAEGDYVVTVTARNGANEVRESMTVRIATATAEEPSNGVVHLLYLPFVTKSQ